jgi:energy-coupling factor transporter transmembrane protein EcfT
MGSLWYLVKRAKELWSWYSFVVGVTALVVTFGAGVIAGLSTTWGWYWSTFNWAGVAFAFLVAWFVLALGIFLIGTGVARWRREESPADNTMPIEPAAPVVPPARPGFIQITPKYLMDLYEGHHTTLQANTLAAAYIGKKIAVDCRVQDVILDSTLIGAGTVVAAKDADQKLILANFGTKDKDTVEYLHKGAKIAIGGKINSISSLFLGLSDCEVIAPGM